MKTWFPAVLLAFALVACSGDAPAPSATTGAAPESTTVAPRSDPTARARLGIVFSDSDPWMAGAVLENGRIQVGDRLFLRTDDDAHIPVTITAIRDDTTQTDVTEATAPRGVFLSFSRLSAQSRRSIDNYTLLTGDASSSHPESKMQSAQPGQSN